MRIVARVAIITPDIMGPVKNGGVGSAFFWLACHLAEENDVTIYLAPERDIASSEFDYWRTYYASWKITLRELPHADIPVQCTPQAIRSYRALFALEAEEYDVAHFPDMGGLGHFAALSRHQGIALLQTWICVHLHGPTLWHRLGSGELLGSDRDVELSFLERSSIEHADFVLSPSQAMANWVNSQGWGPRQPIHVIPHAPLPWRPEKPLNVAKTESSSSEIAFLGRLETRKGLIEFLDALEILDPGLKVRFIGRSGEVLGRDGEDYLKTRAATLAHQIDVQTEFGHLETLEYLQTYKPLVVLPSRLENSPCVVAECLNLGLPFLASDVGGVREMIDPEDSDVLFPSAAMQIAKAIDHALHRPEGAKTARPSSTFGSSGAAWDQFHKRLMQLSHPSDGFSKSVGERRISVCIATRDRTDLLAQALTSLVDQTHHPFEVIIANDSDNPDSILKLSDLVKDFKDRLNLSIISTQGIGPSAARNRAALSAQGDFLLFMDDDNLAEPFELECFLRAQSRTGADLLSCFFDRFSSGGDGTVIAKSSRWLALGPCIGLAPQFNVFGDTNFFVRREAFLASGGFSSDVRLGEDWELMWRMHDHGYHQLVVPKSLFRYRDHLSNRSLALVKSPALKFDVLKATMVRWPEQFRDLLMFGAGKHLRMGAFNDKIDSWIDTTDEWTLWCLSNPARTFPSSARDLKINCHGFGWALYAESGDPQFTIQLPSASAQGTTLRASIHSCQNATLQIYIETEGRVFEEQDTRHVELKIGWNEISVQLGPKRIGRLVRIDFGENPGQYLIRKLQISTRNREASGPSNVDFECIEVDSPAAAGQFDQISWDGIVAQDCTLEKSDDHLIIECSSDDPRLMFPALEFNGLQTMTSFYLDMASDVSTVADLFFQLPGQNGFLKNQRLSFLVEKKRSRRIIAIFHGGPVKNWRFDPGSTPGTYQIFSFGVVRENLVAETKSQKLGRELLPAAMDNL